MTCKGSGDICRSLVKKGAILGTLNKAGVNIFNHPVATKQLLFRYLSYVFICDCYDDDDEIDRLLDLLSQEPRWGEGDCCEECMVTTTIISHISVILSLPGQVWTDHSPPPLPPLWQAALLQVLGQGDANHEV